MKEIKIFFIIVSAIAAVACSKDNIEVWKDKSCVWFTDSDTTIFSFRQYEAEVTEAIVEFELSMAGQTASYDRKIHVEMITSPHDPATKVEITHAMIPADSINGVVKVKVARTANLSEEADTVAFKLTATEDLEPGKVTQLEKALVITDIAGKPEWWDNTLNYYLGTYTEARYRVVIAALGSTEDPYPDDDSNKWLLNRFLIKKYVQDYGPFYEEDETTLITFPNL